jgi:membrane protease YdiL (CAAX protease family)
MALLFLGMRALGVLGPSSWRWTLPLSFVLMALAPWLLLTAAGRQQIGLRRGAAGSWYGLALLAGGVAASACFLLAWAAFGSSPDHPFVSVARSYQATINTKAFSLVQLYLVFTLPALIFSPIGEEIFFRGLLQKTLEQSFSARASTALECGLFGLVHLCHHGLWWAGTGLALRPLSGAVWVLMMMSVAWMFAWLRLRSHSLGPAMLAHMVFNAVMNVFIFVVLWPLLG